MIHSDSLVASGYYRGLTRRAARASLVVFGFLCVGGACMVGAICRAYWLESLWKPAFDRIAEGDTRERVVEIMGSPGQEGPCPRNAGVAGVGCSVAISYAPFPFFEVWNIELDETNRVMSKHYDQID